MATFRVGQRVRIVWWKSRYYGRCATVTGGPFERRMLEHGKEVGMRIAYTVRVDGIGDTDHSNGLGLGYEPHELEPIQDPGRELVSWESMKDLWTPEKLETV